MPRNNSNALIRFLHARYKVGIAFRSQAVGNSISGSAVAQVEGTRSAAAPVEGTGSAVA